jgi:hypothetical protein
MNRTGQSATLCRLLVAIAGVAVLAMPPALTHFHALAWAPEPPPPSSTDHHRR